MSYSKEEEKLFAEFCDKLDYDDESNKLEFFDITEDGIICLLIDENITKDDFPKKYNFIFDSNILIQKINDKFQNKFVINQNNFFQNMVSNQDNSQNYSKSM
jgi:hypothetical protein